MQLELLVKSPVLKNINPLVRLVIRGAIESFTIQLYTLMISQGKDIGV